MLGLGLQKWINHGPHTWADSETSICWKPTMCVPQGKDNKKLTQMKSTIGKV